MSKSLKSCLRCWCSKCVINEGGAAKVEWFLRMGECMDSFCEWESVWNGMKPRRDCVEMEGDLRQRGSVCVVCCVVNGISVMNGIHCGCNACLFIGWKAGIACESWNCIRGTRHGMFGAGIECESMCNEYVAACG
ncbi:S ribonuclease [Pyrus ussuriensis x Pyrus communis]|uniref:S ribonuclease n=1 Tax=Pyrus ussuriensis x Pyrus communis TaxID=2448454 RepID=A0A5N5HRE3_9ROSA|nr:S ribonuclease [Pyrus ussuriensis x Pyrus communis]